LQAANSSAWHRALTPFLRQRVLGWLGVVGTALTLAAGLQAFTPLASSVQLVIEFWSFVTSKFWEFVLPFAVHLNVSDVYMLNTLFFIFALEQSSLRKPPKNSQASPLVIGQTEREKYEIAANFGMLICMLAFALSATHGSGSTTEPGLLRQLDDALFSPRLDLTGVTDAAEIAKRRKEWMHQWVLHHFSRGPFQEWGWLLFVLALVALPKLATLVGRVFQRFHSHRARAKRVWLVIGLATLLVGLNYLLLWIEGRFA
jgi:hypothetical protein